MFFPYVRFIDTWMWHIDTWNIPTHLFTHGPQFMDSLLAAA